ncbi:DUF4265 domain-containing protein [Streptomyces nodosus]
MFENLEIFLDDRADSLDRWCRKRFAFLPPDIRAELDTWIGLLRHGTSRRRPRARSTVVTLLRPVLPFLTEYGGKYTTLRQVTRDDLTTWLTNRYHRAYEASALRSLFGTLKAERLIFSNPMHGIKGGRIPTTIPASLTTEEVEEIAQAALQDPDLRVVVALSGIHALAALQIRTLLLDQVDLAECRLDPESLNRPLDEYTAKAITDYLDHRRGRWPDSTNPHLLISRNTATTTSAVGALWLDKLVKLLPVGLDRLRQDRILEEALASGAEPLHLAHGLDGQIEQLWLKPLNDGTFSIACIPLRVYGLALGDRVLLSEDDEVNEVVGLSWHRVLRMLMPNPDPKRLIEATARIKHEIDSVGLLSEWSGDRHVAIDVPPQTTPSQLFDVMQREVAEARAFWEWADAMPFSAPR